MEFAGGAGATALRSASNGIVQWGSQVGASFNRGAAPRSQRKGSVVISAKIKKGKKSSEHEYPWPEKLPQGEFTDGALKFLNRFKPLTNPPKPVTLPFERPIVDLENKIDEVSSSS